MTYLSRVWLNPHRTQAQRFLRDPQTAHATILTGISRQPVTERVLWRLEPDPTTTHRLGLLILTESRPSWQTLVEQAGWPDSDDPQALTRPYEPLLDQIMLGRHFAFRLKANPVSSTKHPEAPSVQQKEHLAGQRPRGVRVPHRTAAHQLAWLTDRLPRWGFALLPGEAGLPQVRLIARDRLSFRKRRIDDQPGAAVVLQSATFEGIVEVTDVAAARHSLLSGVGAAKAYGLGLITLAPPTTPDEAA